MAPALDGPPELPPELEDLARSMDGEPKVTRELFHYALAILLEQDGQAELIVRHTASERQYLTYMTAAGDTFTVARPEVSEELLDELVRQVRKILDDSRDGEPESEAGR